MSTQLVPGHLLALGAPAQVAQQTADRIAEAVRRAVAARGRAAIALSGGNTPRDAYARLAQAPGMPWSNVRVFWVDERAVTPTSDRSNYRWAKATLLDPAQIPPTLVHRMPADRADLDVAAQEYERLIREQVQADDRNVPAFDGMVLGVGDDGHTASLFPGDPTVDIVDRLVVSVPPKAERNEARMTMTSPLLQAAREVFVLAVGAAKRQPLERVWNVHGDVHDTPARVVRECRGAVTWIVDREAAGLTG
ncbi:MAG TPA: 6-phosphogluconolactonase [Polyangiaceae bacterium]|nr:6-phosphogluconolactonase [Polyangiaceae bacterium]